MSVTEPHRRRGSPVEKPRSDDALVRNFIDALHRPWHHKDTIERIARILVEAERSDDVGLD
jgi:hypothetical protein